MLTVQPALLFRQQPLQPSLKTVWAGGLAFPYDSNLPPESMELFADTAITANICFEFSRPKLKSRLRKCRLLTSIVAMPKTAVNEHHRFVSRQDDIRATRKELIVQPIAKAEMPNSFTDQYLGTGIGASHTTHEPTSLFERQPVHNRRQLRLLILPHIGYFHDSAISRFDTGRTRRLQG
jgi:hypothetical protein